MSEIKEVIGREIIDSRGFPTVEAEIHTVDGSAIASVPSGASTGKYEAHELRDGDNKRFLGKGVSKAVENINTLISNHLKGHNTDDQKSIDDLLIKLDGTNNKEKLGANAILAVSMANYRFTVQYQDMPDRLILPVPLINVLNGGVHADNGLDIQEFMIVPAGFESFSDSLQAGVETFINLKEILQTNGYSTAVGDEGGFAPSLKSNEEALELIAEAINKAGYRLGKDIYLALDVAASEIYKDRKYKIDKQLLPSEKIIEYYKKIISTYPIISIEDPFHEDDWDAWSSLTQTVGSAVQIVGDDLFVTNEERLRMGIEQKAGNSILVKINQIGTISETLKTIELAKENNYSYIISHRSGETEDTIISDIAVATASGQIKTGSCSRTDRTAKYNQLLRIEDFLGKKSKFAKLSTFHTGY